MANPADDLYEIFKLWRSAKYPSSSAQPLVRESRQLSNTADADLNEGWKTQLRAMRCLQAISLIIDEMEQSGDSVESERAFFREWCKAVLAYPNGWDERSSGVNNEAFTTLGLFRNSVRRFVPDLKTNVIEELKTLLAEEPDLTPPPGVYPVELYDYFTRVRFHLKKCIDDYSVTSTFDLKKAAEDYRAAVFMMSNGKFVTNPADWSRHAVKTFSATAAKQFGSAIYNEAENQLAKSTIRALGSAAQKALEI